MYDYHQFMSTAVIMYKVKGEYSIVLPNTLIHAQWFTPSCNSLDYRGDITWPTLRLSARVSGLFPSPQLHWKLSMGCSAPIRHLLAFYLISHMLPHAQLPSFWYLTLRLITMLWIVAALNIF